MAITGIVADEIRAGPDAIRATLAQSMPAARDAAAMLRERDARRVFVIGNGTSYHSALAASGLYARHAGPGDPVVVPLTAGAFRAYRPRLGPSDAVIGISASGEFVDVVAVAEDLHGKVPTVGVVHVPESRLARVADRLVVSSGGPSSAPVMTKTFSATLVAAELTLLALLGAEVLADGAAQIAEAADHAGAAIRAAEQGVDDAVDALERVEHVFVVGAGLAHVAGMEAALKLKEIALVHAEGGETWEATSGAATMIDDRAVVIALAPEGAGAEATRDLVRHVAGWGATTIEVATAAAVPSSLLLPIPAEAREDHAPLVAVPPVALAAYALARRRGIDADRPDWVARYHSQGLRHIVGVEAHR
jgi:glucosamine--fructose-6-phosphate aminotransferase (isomerizing)